MAFNGIQNSGQLHSWIFEILSFEQLVSNGRLIRGIMQNLVKTGKTLF